MDIKKRVELPLMPVPRLEALTCPSLLNGH